MFKGRDELILLDDVTKEDIERELGVNVVVSECDAYSMLRSFIEFRNESADLTRG